MIKEIPELIKKGSYLDSQELNDEERKLIERFIESYYSKENIFLKLNNIIYFMYRF